jgi:hypothetical protein
MQAFLANIQGLTAIGIVSLLASEPLAPAWESA